VAQPPAVQQAAVPVALLVVLPVALPVAEAEANKS